MPYPAGSFSCYNGVSESFRTWRMWPPQGAEKSLMSEVVLSVAQVVPCTEAEGPGRRFALWFQGCPLRCPGCCNPEMLPFEGGQPTPLGEILSQIRRAHERNHIEGITLLGGEPLAHARGAAP